MSKSNIIRPQRSFAKKDPAPDQLPAGLEREIAKIAPASQSSHRRAQVVFATEDSTNPAVTLAAYRHLPPVDMASSAIAAAKSPFVEDQRTADTLALESLIMRALPQKKDIPELDRCIQAVRRFRQVLEGDFSDPVIPERAGERQVPSLWYECRAMAMFAAHFLEKHVGASRDDACATVVRDIDNRMRPYGRIWEVFELLANNAAAGNDESTLAALAHRLKRWIAAENRKQPDNEAIPPGRSAKVRYVRERDALARMAPIDDWGGYYSDFIENCAQTALLLSKQAQEKLSNIASEEPSEQQSTNPGGIVERGGVHLGGASRAGYDLPSKEGETDDRSVHSSDRGSARFSAPRDAVVVDLHAHDGEARATDDPQGSLPTSDGQPSDAGAADSSEEISGADQNLG
jgi:hypothetical protein